MLTHLKTLVPTRASIASKMVEDNAGSIQLNKSDRQALKALLGLPSGHNILLFSDY